MNEPDPKPPAAGAVVCAGCGWANPAGSTACDFCKMPLARPNRDPRARPEPPAREARPAARPPVDERESFFERIGFEPSPQLLIGAVIVLVGLTFFFIQFRMQRKATTADHVRQVKKALEVYAVEAGGYPETIEQAEKRFGPISPFYKKDAWDRPLRYTPGKRRAFSTESLEPLFETCDLRSAGSNGTFDDDDDVVWSGPPT